MTLMWKLAPWFLVEDPARHALREFPHSLDPPRLDAPMRRLGAPAHMFTGSAATTDLFEIVFSDGRIRHLDWSDASS
jgi:hypothetical protein